MANVVGSSVCRTAVDEGKPEDWVPGGEKQTAVDPMKMFHELPREQLFITGSEAARESMRRANIAIAIAYCYCYRHDRLSIDSLYTVYKQSIDSL